MLHFIETPLFTKQIKELTDDDNYRDLQEDLIKNQVENFTDRN